MSPELAVTVACIGVVVQVISIVTAIVRVGARFATMQSAIEEQGRHAADRSVATREAISALVRQDVHRAELESLIGRVVRLEDRAA